VSLTAATNIKLIAEGIETREELEALIRLGVYCGQGYYLQKPSEAFLDISQEKCKIEGCEILCEKIIFEFDTSVLDYFIERDMQNKCIIAEDRNGSFKTFNLTSLSIAGFYGNPNSFITVEKFA